MDKELEKKLRKAIKKQLSEMDIPHSYQSFDTDEFETVAKQGAKAGIEDSGEDFVDLGDSSHESGMNTDEFTSDLEMANLQLPSDEEMLNTVQKNLDKKNAAIQSMRGFSLNEEDPLENEEDPIASAKTASLDQVDWNSEGIEYVGGEEDWNIMSDEEKGEVISFLKKGWHS